MNATNALAVAFTAAAFAPMSTAGAQCGMQTLVLDVWHDELGVDMVLEEGVLLAGQSEFFSSGVGTGRAALFEWNGAQWELDQTLASADPDTDNFGQSVDRDGDVLVVGAPRSGPSTQPWGRVFIYERSGSAWQLVHTYQRPTSGQNWLGSDVAVSGDTILASAYGTQNGGEVDVLERGPNGWARTQVLTADVPVAGDWFGRNIELDGPVAMISASPEEHVHVFGRGPSGWVQTQLLSSSAYGDLLFGHGISLDGSRLLVGGVSAETFVRTPGGWVSEAQFPQVFSGSASSVDLFGPMALVGRSEAGAYEFRLVNDAWTHVATHWENGNVGYGNKVLATALGSFVAAPGGYLGHSVEPGRIFFYADSPLFEDFCHCRSNTPCGNPFDDGGCENAQGVGSILSACGSPSVSRDDLVLTATNLNAGQLALLIMGQGTSVLPLGNGQLCIGTSGLQRFVPGVLADANQTFGPGLVAHSFANFGLAGRIHAGATWNFQVWYRDPGGPCGASSNLTNGLRVQFVP